MVQTIVIPTQMTVLPKGEMRVVYDGYGVIKFAKRNDSTSIFGFVEKNGKLIIVIEMQEYSFMADNKTTLHFLISTIRPNQTQTFLEMAVCSAQILGLL